MNKYFEQILFRFLNAKTNAQLNDAIDWVDFYLHDGRMCGLEHGQITDIIYGLIIRRKQNG